jgi:hypothetical protein
MNQNKNVADTILNYFFGRGTTVRKVDSDFLIETLDSLLAEQKKKAVEAMGEKKPQLDKNDPDNYGACYAIGGYNHHRAEALKRLEEML